MPFAGEFVNMSKTLFKSTTLVSGMTAISRILGFIRDMLVAQLFGATPAVDAFYVAFRIPNFMRGLFAEGAFAQAFVPVLSEYRQKRSLDEVRTFISHVSGTLGSILLLVTIIALILTPLLTSVFAPGFHNDPMRFELTTQMLRITFPYLLLISLTAFGGSVLNSFGLFGVPSFTPVLLNLVMIIAALFLAPHFSQPVVGLAWGVFLAGIAQLLFQLPFLKRHHLLPLPKPVWHDEGVRRVMKLMIPALFGVSVAQISLLIDTFFASFLPAGSITWLYYSDRLTYFPLGIFGVALATVILPHLSRKHADRSVEEFSTALDWALRCVLLIAIPSAVGLFVLSGPLFATLFQHGKFTAFDSIMATRSLMAFSVGLPAFMLVKVLASGFYSRQDIRTPVRIAVIALITNMLLNVALIFPLKHAGLALATSLSSSLNAGLLLRGLLSKKAFIPRPGWPIFMLRLLASGAIVWGLLAIFSPALTQWFSWTWPERTLHLFLLLMMAMGAYFFSLWLSGVRLRHFRSTPDIS
jgi:putative peptidoglycan lipid II flippase